MMKIDRIFAQIILKCQANGFLGNLSPLVGFFYHKETKIKVSSLPYHEDMF